MAVHDNQSPSTAAPFGGLPVPLPVSLLGTDIGLILVLTGGEHRSNAASTRASCTTVREALAYL